MWFAFNLYLWNIGNNCETKIIQDLKLWFAFNLYLWNIGNNHKYTIAPTSLVVICFQFVSLKYWQQRKHKSKLAGVGCDLLSICIFEILATTILYGWMVSISLWFAFNLYLWNIGNNTNNINANWCTLWFAFNLYLWNIGNNIEPFNLPRWSVVICFQFVSLKYWQQLPIAIPLLKLGCDLLSICIFEILATTMLIFSVLVT